MKYLSKDGLRYYHQKKVKPTIKSYIDKSLDKNSENAVSNKAVTTELEKKLPLTGGNIIGSLSISENVSAESFIGELSGNASSANKLNTNAGSTTQPVYFKDGIPVATTYTLEKSVPSDAVFTDTHYIAHLYAGAIDGNSNAATTNGNTFLILTDNDSVRNRLKIIGDGATSVSSSSNGIITIRSTDTNTWRGIQNNLTSGSTTESLSAYQGYLLANGNARDDTKIPLSGSSSITGNLMFANSGTTPRGVGGIVGDNDYWRVYGRADGSNSGYLEIATADDGNEPILVRQYTGEFATQQRTAYLLDGNGNTYFPGNISSGGKITAGLGLDGLGFSSGSIRNGGNDCAGLDKYNNMNICSWWGVSFSTGCSGFTGSTKPAVSIDCRHGYLYTASTIYEGGTSLSSKYAASSHAHNYLPLTGGTLSGTVTVNAPIVFGASDSYGIYTSTNNYACIGSSDKKFYKSFISNMYGNYVGASDAKVTGAYITDVYLTNANFGCHKIYSSANAFILKGNGTFSTGGLKITNYTPGNGIAQNYSEVTPIEDNASNLGQYHTRWSTVCAATGTINTSDRNLKKDINPLTELHKKFFLMLQPVSFIFTDGQSGRTHIGFISQDVEDIMNSLGMSSLDFAGFCKDQKTKEITNEKGDKVRVPDLDENGNPKYIYSLRYSEFIAINTFMIQELYHEVEDLKNTVSKLSAGE